MRTVLVTGASVGIGAAIARRLSEDLFVLIGYKSHAVEARKLAAEIGGEAVYLDLGEKGIDASCQVAAARGVEILINNAGIAHFDLIQEMPAEEVNRQIAVNLTASIRLTQAVLPSMIERKYGRIVNISSILGIYGGSCESVYSAAKAGLIGFTKAVAREVAPSGITVNAIAAGLIDTAMNAGLTAQDRVRLIDATPVGRIGRAEDVAEAAAFFVSDSASFVTAQVLGVDGGLVL